MIGLIAQAAPAAVSGASSLISGLGPAGVAIGAGIVVAGAAKGIGHLAGSAMEGIARQPEAGGRIGTNMIIAAALIEGFTFFALVICMMLSGKL